MKRIKFVLVALLVTLNAKAQNTFPATGNVGIGTTSPSYPLDVNGAIRALGAVGYRFSSNNDVYLRENYGPNFGLGGSSSMFGANFLNAAGVSSLYIRGDGNVGIGTTTPSAPLQVEGGYDPTSGQVNCGTESASCPASAASGFGLALDTIYTDGRYRWRLESMDRGGNVSLYVQQSMGTANSYTNAVRFGFNQFDSNTFSVFGNSYLGGSVGIGTASPGAKLDIAGNVKLSGGGASITFPDNSVQSTAWNGTLCGGDYAESVDIAGDHTKYEPGDVLVLSDGDNADVAKSLLPYSTLVAGVYSTKPGVLGRRQTAPQTQQEVPMAMVGIVPTKVSAESGPIRKGDLLVTSSIAGHAMKGTDPTRMLGAIVGKAMGSLDSGTGVIEVLVSLQ